MKKNILFTLLLMAFAMVATAQNKKIAILETVDKEGNVPYGIRLQLRSNLTYAISNTPGYEGFDRVDMAQIVGEHDFQRTGMVSDEQIRKLGAMTGCSSILVAEAAVYDKDNIIITAKILNVETASVERSVPPYVSSINAQEIQLSCESLANRLLGLPNPLLYDYTTPSDFIAQQPEEKPIEESTVTDTVEKILPSKSYEPSGYDNMITKQGKNYYQNGKHISKDEYVSYLLSNCPQAYTSYNKGAKLQTIGWITLGVGVAIASITPFVNTSSSSYSVNGNTTIVSSSTSGVSYIGPALTLGSIPLIIIGGNRKNNAYKVYNQYCAKQPTATLRVAPATQSMGVGVYLDF